MKIVKEEVILGSFARFAVLNLVKIFGPVVAVGKFETEQEAIELANATTYGLAAGIQSSPSSPLLFPTNVDQPEPSR